MSSTGVFAQIFLGIQQLAQEKSARYCRPDSSSGRKTCNYEILPPQGSAFAIDAFCSQAQKSGVGNLVNKDVLL